MARDYGFAPNPFHGYCTLATCKPNIRRHAGPGDLVVGCGSVGNDLVGRAIYVMRVSESMGFQQYWDDPRFLLKRPNLFASRMRAFGDNIYHQDGGDWIQEDSHHSFEGGGLNEANLRTDTGADNVLISQDFAYWGRDAIVIPENLRDFNGDDLYSNVRDRRARFAPDFVQAIDAWFVSLESRGYLGRPEAWS